MKSKGYLFGFACVLFCAFTACKSTPSAYHQVYEAAQSRPTVPATSAAPVVSKTPVAPVDQRTPEETSSTNFKVEKLISVDGSGIKQYSVVIGSFVNKTNAESLKNRMHKDGYNPVIALNEAEMYRVIIVTFDDKADAISIRDYIKRRYAPNFSDAWLLEKAR
ncbi:MAG: hypothetical protein EZS26_000850 [Candidatus Ordinivivax streblomastigis]|uniref:SPOR domain-containing protein n=1 Tax=Candidatus Ordinivivax streblomastigis TaxID=2540710 RepID=A0A5M8P399_9BACT|nr:MAG: hypothetical protein EZS26_000850 [Candidatus Ordinivivax streblomastigis]